MVAVVAFAAPALAATNPFMDVPQGHWSYDAVGLLASRGIVSGYPDGAFKGAQPATRYEMASVVARALVTVDAEKASKQDLELLKKLVMEFKDELDALGVKVDSLDKRVAVLEDGLGGWKVRGTFWFDASFAGGDKKDHVSSYTGTANDTEFNKQRFRLYLTKQIDENTLFYAELRAGENENNGWGRGDMYNARIRDMYLQTKLPWDIGFRAGRLLNDWEGDRGFYDETDALFTDFRYDGFEFTKAWGGLKATAFVGRNTSREKNFDQWPDNPADADAFTLENGSYMSYGLNLDWQATEQFFVGASAFFFDNDGDALNVNEFGEILSVLPGDYSFNTYGAYLGYDFTDAIGLKGIYYWQDLDSDLANTLGGVTSGAEDSPTAWKAVLTVDQDLLKFTGLRVEYLEQDNMFIGVRDYYGLGTDTGEYAHVLQNMKWDNETTKMWFVRADQQWNEKWSSFIRYIHADLGTTGIDDADSYGIAVKYQYTPAIAFRLLYDYVDHGEGTQTYNGDEHVIQFRTTINF